MAGDHLVSDLNDCSSLLPQTPIAATNILFCLRIAARRSAIFASSRFTNSMIIMFLLKISSHRRSVYVRPHEADLLQAGGQRAVEAGIGLAERAVGSGASRSTRKRPASCYPATSSMTSR